MLQDMKTIYLDYNATTPIAPSVQETMLPFLREHYGNPSSHHSLGRAGHEAVEDARVEVAALLSVDPQDIVFTSGGTESNNLALKGILLREVIGGRGHLIISALEHPAITEPARYLRNLGCEVTVVGCGPDGVVHPEAVREALRPDTVLVSIMHANNEIGTIQPIREIASICHEQNVLMHTDAAQSIGKIHTFADELEVDLLTIAGHKIYGPKGVGALYVRRGTPIEPLLHGASHEQGLRAGTENVPYLVALGRACTLASKAVEETSQNISDLRDRLVAQLQHGIGDGLSVNGAAAARLPNTASVNFPDVSAHDMLAYVPELCVSTGAACHSGATSISPTLAAMSLTPEVAKGTIRLSLGWYTSQEDIDLAASRLLFAWDACKS